MTTKVSCTVRREAVGKVYRLDITRWQLTLYFNRLCPQISQVKTHLVKKMTETLINNFKIYRPY